jgi:hypothetical protein
MRVADALEISEGPQAGKEFTLSGTPTIGRDPGADIVVDDPEASRRHAQVRQGAGGGWEVEDLGSRNGTYVNDSPIDSPRPLAAGDELRIGTTVLVVKGAAEAGRSAVRKAPAVTQLGQGVLQPARPEELAPAPQQPAGLRAPEGRPGYIDPRIAEGAAGGGAGGGGGGGSPDGAAAGQNLRLGAWIDTRVKQQTNVAAFAFVAVAALAVAIYFGVT